ncbi:hypothetical protein PP175_07950 [Aneurinibacillus sp. Ricciae_BoGa-3]|uniref:hypothetical protein n=1 Tax=Aneurinibacillus sp. Ricciae_BoGa-3 TaxID=3022697 RepID=UPI002341E4C6|nr:hypothetical protein [Aneurinibacillus sp. Ricciae_BoGa-3]WCK55847.1 hypothetical protein PP175_07950 [Aneurinibacillus sp. Ricciae_BoGa-3]
MDKIAGLDTLEHRFNRLRTIVDNKRVHLKWIEEDVRQCFQENDMVSITQLAAERRQTIAFVEAIERFIDKWELRWQESEAASNWVSEISVQHGAGNRASGV